MLLLLLLSSLLPLTLWLPFGGFSLPTYWLSRCPLPPLIISALSKLLCWRYWLLLLSRARNCEDLTIKAPRPLPFFLLHRPWQVGLLSLLWCLQQHHKERRKIGARDSVLVEDILHRWEKFARDRKRSSGYTKPALELWDFQPDLLLSPSLFFYLQQYVSADTVFVTFVRFVLELILSMAVQSQYPSNAGLPDYNSRWWSYLGVPIMCTGIYVRDKAGSCSEWIGSWILWRKQQPCYVPTMIITYSEPISVVRTSADFVVLWIGTGPGP